MRYGLTQTYKENRDTFYKGMAAGVAFGFFLTWIF